jgi:hypothetical protein
MVTLLVNLLVTLLVALLVTLLTQTKAAATTASARSPPPNTATSISQLCPADCLLVSKQAVKQPHPIILHCPITLPNILQLAIKTAPTVVAEHT